MKILLLAFGLMFSVGTAQADYKNLVEQKLDRLTTMKTRVAQMSDLTATDKAWATQHLNESQAVLIEMSTGTLEELQMVEQAVNETCAEIAGRVLATKKAKLVGRIAQLDAMIERYQLEGLNTAELEALSDSMKVQVEGL